MGFHQTKKCWKNCSCSPSSDPAWVPPSPPRVSPRCLVLPMRQGRILGPLLWRPRSRVTGEAGPLGSADMGCRLKMVSLRRKHRAALTGRRGAGAGGREGILEEAGVCARAARTDPVLDNPGLASHLEGPVLNSNTAASSDCLTRRCLVPPPSLSVTSAPSVFFVALSPSTPLLFLAFCRHLHSSRM